LNYVELILNEKNKGYWENRVLECSFLFKIPNPSHSGELKNCNGERFSNLLYVVIILLKLKMY